MSHYRKLGLVGGAFAAILAAAPAHAEAPADHPALAPTRDVVVTYRFWAGGNAAAPEKKVMVSFAADGNQLRIDPIGVQGITILDRLKQRVTLISTEKKSYIQFLPVNGLSNPFMLSLNMTYHAEGMGTVAGHECRRWSIESPKGKAQACVTDDGVILAEAGVDSDGVSGKMEAQNVTYRDLPASTFEPPEGYQKIQRNTPSQKVRQGEPVPGANVVHHHAETGHQVDTTQPAASNDSASDGSVYHSDQPSHGAGQ